MPNIRRPLCIDLDGTLLNTDAFLESGLRSFAKYPLTALKKLILQWRTPAPLKAWAYETGGFNAEIAPYNQDVVAFAEREKDKGRTIILVTASNEHIAQGVCEHFKGLFTQFIASDSEHNIRGQVKADKLVENYGEYGFDYMGNDKSDLKVWQHCHTAYVVNQSADLAPKIIGAKEVNTDFAESNNKDPKLWFKAFRSRQWLKNLLLFIAPIVAHKLDFHTLSLAFIGFICFSLVSSSGYIMNDLFDVEDDRMHPEKKYRPFASGALNPIVGLKVSALLAVLGIGLGFFLLSPIFAGVCLIYLISSLLYSLFFKSLLLLDIYTLGAFFTLRVVAGGIATDIPLSLWLLSFLWLLFTGIAYLKRYAELDGVKRGRLEPSNRRSYRAEDERTIAMLGIATSALTMPILALYAASPDAKLLYSHAWLLWLIAPIVWAWQTRLWLIASRGEMDLDPVEFLIRDRVGHVLLLIVFTIMWIAQ